jgi:hypothetical protein
VKGAIRDTPGVGNAKVGKCEGEKCEDVRFSLRAGLSPADSAPAPVPDLQPVPCDHAGRSSASIESRTHVTTSIYFAHAGPHLSTPG